MWSGLHVSMDAWVLYALFGLVFLQASAVGENSAAAMYKDLMRLGSNPMEAVVVIWIVLMCLAALWPLIVAFVAVSFTWRLFR